MRELGDAVRRAARVHGLAVAILAVGWLIVVAYAYPGQMTQDSFEHLIEARKGWFTDSHPPFIPALWRVVDAVVPGPFGMLVLQLTCFEIGLYWILRRTFDRRGAAIAACALLLFPPVMVPLPVIWKDCLMAGFLTLGIGAIGHPRRAVRVGALGALMLASAARYNAFVATLPIVVLLFQWAPAATRLRRYAIAGGAWCAITVMAFGLNAALTDRRMHFWHSSLALFDITGTLAHVEPRSDAELTGVLVGTGLLVDRSIHARLREAYDPRDFLPLVTHPRRALWNVPISGDTPAPEAQRDAISRAWWDVVSSYPIEYVEHRVRVMAEVLCLGEVSRPAAAITRRDYRYPEVARSLGIDMDWSSRQRAATRWLLALWEHTPLFVPWLYLVLALVWLPLTRKARDVLAVLLSGLALEGSLLVLAPSPDYRYSHWMVACTTLAILELISRRLRSPTAAPGAVHARDARP